MGMAPFFLLQLIVSTLRAAQGRDSSVIWQTLRRNFFPFFKKSQKTDRSSHIIVICLSDAYSNLNNQVFSRTLVTKTNQLRAIYISLNFAGKKLEAKHWAIWMYEPVLEGTAPSEEVRGQRREACCWTGC